MKISQKKFKEIRDRHGLTLKQIAEKLGVAESTVHSWEHGVYFPRSPHIIELKKLLQCSLYDIAEPEPGEEFKPPLSAHELSMRGFIVPGVQLAPVEMVEAFRQAILREIMLSDNLDSASKEAAYKIIATFQMPPVDVKQ